MIDYNSDPDDPNSTTEKLFKFVSKDEEEAFTIVKTEVGYPCPYCSKPFMQRCKLKNHLIVHSADRPWKCQICDKTFKHKRVLDYHEKTVHGEPQNYPCDICGKIFSNKRNCVVHRNRHTREYTVKCQECGKSFLGNFYLKKHMIVHSEERPHQCPACGKSFKHQRVLDYHFKTLHGDESHERHPCDICGKIFSNRRNCDIHRKRHLKQYTVYCEHCGKGFLNNFYLKKHLNSKHYGKRHICDVCGASIGDKSNMRNHMKLHDPNYKKPLPEVCNICHKAFSNLKRHYKAAHENDGKNYKCEYCGKFFRGKDGLKFHLMIHRGEKPFSCQFCGKAFILNTFLQQHLRTHPESNVKPFECVVCGKTFIKKSLLEYHMNTHTGSRPFQCEFCSKAFTGRKYLTAHVRSQHAGATEGLNSGGEEMAAVIPEEVKVLTLEGGICLQFKSHRECPTCRKTFKTNTSLVFHIKNIHTSQRGFKCDICSKVVSNKRYFQLHMRTHKNDYRFFCDHCGKGFVHKHQGKQHMESIHNPSPNSYVCDVCGKKFSATSYLKKHQMRHSGSTEPKTECKICNKSYVRIQRHYKEQHSGQNSIYMCHLCGQKFKQSFELKLHMMRHKGEKPHQCSYEGCFKSFVRKQHLSLHMRSHTGEKPFVCAVCGNRYTQKPSLVIHMRGHLGEKPYGCDLCWSKFASKQRLNIHKRKVHKLVGVGGKKKAEIYIEEIKIEVTADYSDDDNDDLGIISQPNISESSLTNKVNPKAPLYILVSSDGYKCPRCPAIFKELKMLKSHFVLHKNEVSLSCTICYEEFTDPRILSDHLTKDHDVQTKYPCGCGQMLASRRNYERHQMHCEFGGTRELKGEDATCPACNQKFPEKLLLNDHWLKRHARKTESGRIGCPKCDNEYQSMYQAMTHYNEHLEEKRFFCHHCEKGFITQQSLTYHIEDKHAGTRILCNICGKSLRNRNTLSAHMKGHNPHASGAGECDRCGKYYRNLKLHQVEAHESLLSCSICDKTFTSQRGLQLHIMIHKGDKRFTCEFCGRRFLMNTFLQSHLRTHPESGVDPFTCDECGKTFSRKVAYEDHLNSHKGHRPYRCVYCDKAFEKRKSYAQHKRLKHGNAKKALKDNLA